MTEKCCYVFEIDKAERSSPESRAITSRGLFHGLLQPESLSARQACFRELWERHEKRVDDAIAGANRSSVLKVVSFLSSFKQSTPSYDSILSLRNDDRLLPASFVVAGAGIGSQRSFFSHLSTAIESEGRNILITMSTDDAPNLKAFLKQLIHKVYTKYSSLEEGVDGSIPKEFHLKYDLRALQAWASAHRVKDIVVAFEDVEAFSVAVLRDVIDLFHSWSDRLSFALVFGIATSAEHFYDKLSPGATQRLDGQVVSLIRPQELLEKFLEATIEGDPFSVRLGANMVRSIVAWHTSHSQSIQLLLDSLKYAYLCHFLSNPLSIFLLNDLQFEDVPASHFKALRNIPSFRYHTEQLVSAGELHTARQLLQSDEFLFETARREIQKTNAVFSKIAVGSKMLERMQHTILPARQHRKLSEIFIGALQGNYGTSAFVREILMALKKHSSDVVGKMLEGTLPLLKRTGDHLLTSHAEKILAFLESLLREPGESTDVHKSERRTRRQSRDRREGEDEEPFARVLRSEYNVQTSAVRMTVVAQKVGLSRHRSTLTEEEQTYSGYLGFFYNLLETFFATTFPRTNSPAAPASRVAGGGSLALFQPFPFSECVLFDHAKMFRSAFMPRSRQAIHRALTVPRDYLNCDCCVAEGVGHNAEEGEGAITASLPDTAILYQLCHEATGSLINVADLLTAFEAVKMDGAIGRKRRRAEEGDDDEHDGGDEGSDDGADEAEAGMQPRAIAGRSTTQKNKSTNKDKKAKREEEKRAQAEVMPAFQHAFAELVFLGLLKRTGKRRDHVARGAWCGI